MYAWSGECSHQCKTSNSSVTSVWSFECPSYPGDEKVVKLILDIGPMTAQVYVDNSWSVYTGGIFDEPNCTGDANHSVLLVGYGTENGTDYWIARNRYLTYKL